MEAGDCPPLNINAMWAISVKSYLNQNSGTSGFNETFGFEYNEFGSLVTSNPFRQ